MEKQTTNTKLAGMEYEPRLSVAFIAPYLPYRISAYDEKQQFKTDTIVGIHYDCLDFECWSPLDLGKIENYKLILRPISDLEKTIEHNLDVFIPIERLRCKYNYPTLKSFEFNNGYGSIEANLQTWQTIGFCIFQQLFEWHFDVFGLIEKGLAVPYDGYR